MSHLPHGPSVAHPQPGLAHTSRGALLRASVAQLATALTALLVFSAGAAVVLGLTHYLITSQAMDDAHALKAYTIAGGIIAGGAFIPFMTGKAKALLIIGIVAAEAFNIGLIAETTWRERAAAHAERAEAHKRDVADHAARVKARADAEARLTRAESAADAKEQARAADASKRDCKRECMAGHLEAVTAARAEVTAARNALLAAPDAHPHPPQLPPETDMPLGKHWDLVMAVLSSIGGNLIAIGLFSFAGSLVARSDSPSSSRPERAGHASNTERVLPTILVADVSAADAVLLQSENDRALSAFRASVAASLAPSVAHPQPAQATARGSSLASAPPLRGSCREAAVGGTPDEQFAAIKARALASAQPSGLSGLFSGEQPDPADNVVRLFARPGAPNGSPDGSGGPKGGRKVRQTPRANDRKADVLADIQARIDRGERFASQEELRAVLAERFGPVAKSSLSDWLGELSGQIVRRQAGRRKVVG